MNDTDTKNIDKLKKLITSKRSDLIQSGLELLKSLDSKEIWDAFLTGIQYNGKEFFKTEPPLRFKNERDLLFLVYYSCPYRNIYLDPGVVTGLELNNLPFKITDLSMFSNLKKLKFIQCAYFTDADVLLTVPGANNIEIRKINSIDNLRGLQALKSVYLSLTFNDLKNIDFLAGSANISKLSILKSSIENIDGLAGCSGIKTLTLGTCTELKNIRGISACSNLTSLTVSWARYLKSLEGLSVCTKLKNLSISTCDSLEDISAVGRLDYLEKFSLEGMGSSPLLSVCRSNYVYQGIELVELKKKLNHSKIEIE